MNDKMVLGQYYHADSFIHRLDPRTKIFALIVMMVVTFMIPFNNFLLLGICAAFVLITILLTKAPLLQYLKSLKQIAFLLVFSFAFQLFTNKEGSLLYSLDLSFSMVNVGIVVLLVFFFFFFRKFLPFKMFLFLLLCIGALYIFHFPMGVKPFGLATIHLYEGGLISGTFIISRVFIIILLSTALTLTTKPMDLANGLEWYLKPFEWIKLKPSILAMMISIALRFIPTLFNETDKILKAQASRGVDFKEGKLHEQIKQIVSLLVPMFVISFKRAVDLADAMEARGYIPGAKRTRLLKLTFHIRDLISVFVILSLLTFIIIWKVCYAI